MNTLEILGKIVRFSHKNDGFGYGDFHGHPKFIVRLECDNRSGEFVFHESVGASAPNYFSVLQCLIADSMSVESSVDEFCAEFGYNNSVYARQILSKIKQNTAHLFRVLNITLDDAYAIYEYLYENESELYKQYEPNEDE